MFGMGLALVLLILVPIQASLVNYSKLDSLDQFAQAWDERDVEIRASSVADLEISLLPVENKGGLQALNSNPQSFMNVCAAKYYGLNTLIAVP